MLLASRSRNSCQRRLTRIDGLRQRSPAPAPLLEVDGSEEDAPPVLLAN